MRTVIKNATSILTMNPSAMRIEGGYIVIEGSWITSVGSGEPPADLIGGAELIDATDKVVLPGLVNTHHHMYQTLTRAVPSVQNAKLFDWLKGLYPIWAKIGDEGFYYGALIAMAEKMLSGCTTTTDHQYLFPKGTGNILDAQIEAGRQIGMRFHPTRGSMSLSEKDGGLPPDSVVQDDDEILADSERLVNLHHDRSWGAMVRVALAPCSPFSVTSQLMQATAELAERLDVRLHTHLAEDPDEDVFAEEAFGRRTIEHFEDVGWGSDRAWVAHCIYPNEDEIARMGKWGTGVAHCPS